MRNSYGYGYYSPLKKKILVIDDSGVFLRSVKSLMEPKYEVFLAKTGEKGVQIAAERQVDLILLDYEMPDWDGIYTYKILKSNPATANIKVVFLTGVNEKDAIMEAIKLQPQGYILKPFERDELDRRLTEIFKDEGKW